MLKSLLAENKKFYSGRWARAAAIEDAPSIVIAALVSNDTHISSVTMKFSKAFAEVLDRKLLVVPNIRNSAKHRCLVGSFVPDRTVSILWALIRTFAVKFAFIVGTAGRIKRGREISELVVDGVA